MKTITTILAVIFTLQTGFIFAGNESLTPSAEVNTNVNLVSVVPSTPSEVTFEDMAVENTFYELSPITPMVADFEDFSADMISMNDLSPVMPLVADFSDTVDQVSIDINMISPVTPFEADFE